MITCTINRDRGSTTLTGSNIPNGAVVLTRTSPNELPYILRGGKFNVTTGGFLREDSEVPFGIPLTYTAELTVPVRHIQSNLVLTPTAVHGPQSWAPGPSRAMAVVPDATAASPQVARFGPDAGTGNVIARNKAVLIPGSAEPYLFTGRFRFTTPDLWLWQDVRTSGTWAHLKTIKANWGLVRSTTTPAVSDYVGLVVSIVNPVSGVAYIAPVQVITTSSQQVNTWIDFSFFFTTAVDIPPTAEIRFIHGTRVREYGVTWYLDRIGITSGADRRLHAPLYWFDGDTPVPSDPADNLYPDQTWDDISADAAISWSGIAGNSMSTYLGPTKVATATTCLVGIPGDVNACAPVYLSDPVSPARGQWFSLLEFGALSYAARQTLFDIIGRAPQIAVSQLRGWATGQLMVLTRTLAERTRAIATLETGRILLYRNPDPLYPENLWYVAVGSVTESRIGGDARRPERIWTIPFAKVERPIGLIEQVAGRTWSTVAATWTSWDGVKTNNATWLELLYPTGGFTPEPPPPTTALYPSPTLFPSPALFPDAP